MVTGAEAFMKGGHPVVDILSAVMGLSFIVRQVVGVGEKPRKVK